MDIQIERKKGLRILFAKRSLPYWGGMLFLLFAAWLLLRDNASTLRVDAGTLSVAEVTQGDFNDYIRVTGQVEPITTVQLSPLERVSSNGSWSRRELRSAEATCWWS